MLAMLIGSCFALLIILLRWFTVSPTKDLYRKGCLHPLQCSSDVAKSLANCKQNKTRHTLSPETDGITDDRLNSCLVTWYPMSCIAKWSVVVLWLLLCRFAEIADSFPDCLAFPRSLTCFYDH